MEKQSTILVVEDSAVQRAILVRWVKANGYEAVEAESCESAKKLLTRVEIDVVLMDWELPDGSGVELIREVLQSSRNGWVPVIMVTSHTEPEKIREAIQEGATDFIRKPAEEIELIARVYSALRIKALQDKLIENSIRDPLTGLYNRRFLDERTIQEFSRCKRHGSNLSLVIFDIDFFKKINDMHGHEVGDTVLKAIGTRVRENIRNSDILGRFGGEEFVILMPETTPDKACLVMEKIQSIFRKEPIAIDSKLTIPVTFSAGISGGILDSVLNPTELFTIADSRLYEAKNKGRDQVIYA